MPTYVYKCRFCGFEREVWHKMLQEPPIICIKCEQPMNRKPVNGSFILEGDGWTGKDLKKK